MYSSLMKVALPRLLKTKPPEEPKSTRQRIGGGMVNTGALLNTVTDAYTGFKNNQALSEISRLGKKELLPEHLLKERGVIPENAAVLNRTEDIKGALDSSNPNFLNGFVAKHIKSQLGAGNAFYYPDPNSDESSGSSKPMFFMNQYVPESIASHEGGHEYASRRYGPATYAAALRTAQADPGAPWDLLDRNTYENYFSGTKTLPYLEREAWDNATGPYNEAIKNLALGTYIRQRKANAVKSIGNYLMYGGSIIKGKNKNQQRIPNNASPQK